MRGTFRAGKYQPNPDKDFQEELEFHLEMKTDELMEEGLSREAAEAEARRRFGDTEEIRRDATREETRRQRRLGFVDRLDTVWQDLRYAVRTIRRSPGMTTLTLLILAVGIGANAAIFSVLKAVFLQPLPFPEPDQLTLLWTSNIQTGGRGPSSVPDYLDWRDQNQSFQAVGAFGGMNLNLTDGQEPIRIRAAHTTAQVFDVLDVPPALGRTFLPEEDRSGVRVVILSHQLWRDQYDGRPDIVGSTIHIDGGEYTVIGVMPEGFFLPTPWDTTDPFLAWIPFQDWPEMAVRNSYSFLVLARLLEGVPVERAQADMNDLGARLEEAYPNTNQDMRPLVVPLHGLLYGQAGSQILLVLLAAGAVLLIACGNIAGFLLARGTTRQTEMAVRASLGAGKGRIVRQLLTENLLLAVCGGAAAVLLATWSLGGLRTLIPPTLPRTGDIRLDSEVLLFALGLSLATGVLFGIAPALAASRTQLTDALKEGGRTGGGGRKKLKAQNAFVIAQIALSLSLGNAGLLLLQSYASLRQVDQGFDGEHTLTMALSLGGDRYDEDQERQAFYDQLLPRLEAIPGVGAAGVVSKLPLLGGTNGPTITEEAYQEDPTTRGILTEISAVEGDYFASMGIPILAGRTLTPLDRDTVARRVVINEAAANRFWPDEDPLGKRFGFPGDPPEWFTVVGVVGNVRQWGPGYGPQPELYLAYALNPRARMLITLNAAGDPHQLVAAARQAVLSVDPLQPISEIRTMDELLEGQLSGREFYTLLIGLFSLLAILLAAAGIYGVVSYFVAQRTREMGIRLALGGVRRGLVGLVLRRAMAVVAWGLLVGLGGVWASTRIISSLLFGVRPLDPPTLLAGLGILLVVGALAALVPGLRGTSLSPVKALRTE